MVKALLIRVDGTVSDITIDGLDDMQKAIGGYIEAVYLPLRQMGYIDEEGKLKSKPVNHLASAIFDNPSDVIAGDMLVLGDDGEGGNADVDEKFIFLIRKTISNMMTDLMQGEVQ